MKTINRVLLFAIVFIHLLSCKDNIEMSNYYAWCIVPFDSMNRTPQERIEMLKQLGLTSYAYDWREKHLDSFPEEIKLASENNIEINAVWIWIDADYDSVNSLNPLNEKLLKIVEEGGLKTQIWIGFHSSFFENLSQYEAVKKGSDMIGYLNDRVNEIGCKITLYNHGDWFGDPRNQVEVIKELPGKDIGIIYNFHHAHEQLDDYEEIINSAFPYLWAVNLNGIHKEGPKIMTIGDGDREAYMIEYLTNKGFDGPYGILCHIETEDAKVVLKRNIEGLKKLKVTKGS